MAPDTLEVIQNYPDLPKVRALKLSVATLGTLMLPLLGFQRKSFPSEAIDTIVRTVRT